MVEMNSEFLDRARWFLCYATAQGRQQGRTAFFLLQDRCRLTHDEAEKVLALLKAEGFRA